MVVYVDMDENIIMKLLEDGNVDDILWRWWCMGMYENVHENMWT
jgi:hypothetical protein